jgi:putative toxin-antitoxin system antitoxin component (TIGR02293 family)
MMSYMRHSAQTLKFDNSPHDVAAIREGLSARLVESMSQRYDLPKGKMLEAAGIPRSSAHRYKALGRLSKEQSNRLYRVLYLLKRAEDLFGSSDLAAGWLIKDSVFLHGSSPLQYLDTEPGFHAVEHFLGRLEDGMVT